VSDETAEKSKRPDSSSSSQPHTLSLLCVAMNVKEPRLRRHICITSIVIVILVSSVSGAMTTNNLILSGKRVLVTGAGRGIGRAIAVICSKHGAQVAITSRTSQELQETASQMIITAKRSDDETCRSTLQLVADVTNQKDVDTMIDAIVEQWGGLDILINNAGGAQAKKGLVDTISGDDLARLLDLNVVGLHRVTSTVLQKAMLSPSSSDSTNNTDGTSFSIVNISSRAGKIGIATMSHYVASKFAVEGMTATWAKELAPRNIRVNSLSPGMVNTQSFPKPDGKPGVRTAESVEDGLLTLLKSNLSGRYLHVDELDEARAAGLADEAAMKVIDESSFR
jgi:NAD(P)-dependent dehydrogenase (short-subunit alcohol dehydrogenase family)